MSYRMFSLHQLGWRPAYARELTLADFEAGYPARVVAVRGAELVVVSSHGQVDVAQPLAEGDIVLGDWVLLAHDTDRVLRRLTRHSLMACVEGEGGNGRPFLVANVDTVFLESSCDDAFAPSRLQRAATQALESEVTPVMVVTAIGQDSRAQGSSLQTLLPMLPVIAIDPTDAGDTSPLLPWLAAGATVGLVGTAGPALASAVKASVEAPAWLDEASQAMVPTVRGAWVVEMPALAALKRGEPTPEERFAAQ